MANASRVCSLMPALFEKRNARSRQVYADANGRCLISSAYGTGTGTSTTSTVGSRRTCAAAGTSGIFGSL